MAKAKFYTYVHRRADTQEIFYVGKGSRSRAYTTQWRSTYWHRMVNKYGLVIEIVAYFYEEEAAFEHERDLIAELRANGNRIVNLTDGGDGASGAKRSEETRRRMSEAAKRRPPPKPMSAETRAKMSASHKGLKQSPEAIAKTAAFHRGRKRSPETLARMSEATKGKNVGRYVGPETRAKLSELGKGRQHSDETKRKMSAAKVGKPLGSPSPEVVARRAETLKRTLALKKRNRHETQQSLF